MATEKAPGVIHEGIDDKSARAPVPVPETLPDSLAYLPIFTRKGPRTPQYVFGTARNQVFGSETWDRNSKYFNHQTEMALTHAAQCGIMVHRLIPPNAKSALVRLSVKVTPATLPVWERNQDGTIRYSGSGISASPVQKTEAGSPVFIKGHRITLLAGAASYPTLNQSFGQASIRVITGDGETLGIDTTRLDGEINGTGSDSTIYPIYDGILDEGEFGNGIGVRMRTLTTRDRNPVDMNILETIRHYLYRTSIVERTASGLSIKNIATVGGAEYIDLALSDLAAAPGNGQSLSLEKRIIDDWDLNAPGYIPEPGPLKDFLVYHDSIQELVSRLTQGESYGGEMYLGEADFDADHLAYGRETDMAFADPANSSLFNFLSGVDQHGVPYTAVDFSKSTNFGGIAASRDLTIFGEGGNDGLEMHPNRTPNRLANLRIYDGMVQDSLLAFGDDPDARMLDLARYPVRGFWDSGFSYDTKLAALEILGKRSDMYVMLATQSVADWAGDKTNPANFKIRPQNTDEEDLAMALDLSAAADLYPESSVFGTPVCRAQVVGHSGQLVDVPNNPLGSMIYDYATKVASYMGAPNWRDQYAFDLESRKNVTRLQRVNNTWRNAIGYDKAYAANLVYVQYGDRANLFYPAFQTVYRDDTSVLNDAFVMMACCSLQHIHFQVWRELTPTGSMSDQLLIETSDRKLAEKVKDRFNGRFVIIPETTITPADLQNNRSWHSNYRLFANAARDRVYSSVSTYRMSDLQA